MCEAHGILVWQHIYITPNDLPEFPSAALSSVTDATASPPSSALQTENSFYVICLKVNVLSHWDIIINGLYNWRFQIGDFRQKVIENHPAT